MRNNDKWGALSMKDRALLMDMYLKNGIQELSEMKKHYNSIPYRDFNTSDYDYFNASPEMIPTEEGQHWDSRNPHTGQILKSENHTTFDLAVEGEKNAGYKIVRGYDNNLYSIPNQPDNYIEKPNILDGTETEQTLSGKKNTEEYKTNYTTYKGSDLSDIEKFNYNWYEYRDAQLKEAISDKYVAGRYTKGLKWRHKEFPELTKNAIIAEGARNYINDRLNSIKEVKAEDALKDSEGRKLLIDSYYSYFPKEAPDPEFIGPNKSPNDWELLFPSRYIYKGLYVKDKHAIIYDDKEDSTTTKIHERTHASVPTIPGWSKHPVLKKIGNTVLQEGVKADSYYDGTSEIYARLMELRYSNKLDPAHTYTLDEVRAMRNDPNFKDFHIFDRYTDESILMLLNEVAHNTTDSNKLDYINPDNIAANGGRLNKFTTRRRILDGTSEENQTLSNNPWIETGYDILELLDPTGISSWATKEGDLRQAITGYRNGDNGIGRIVLEGIGALPVLGKVGKAIKLSKGVSNAKKILSTANKALKNAEQIDTILELIPGVRKLTSATQGVTGTLMQGAADAFNLSSDTRKAINMGAFLTNNFNTLKDAVDVFNVTSRTPKDTVEVSSGDTLVKAVETEEVAEPIEVIKDSTKYITQDNYLDEHSKFRRAFEEFYPEAYYDEKGDKYTVGTGLTYLLDENGKETPVKRGDTITEKENSVQLYRREKKAEDYARKKTKHWDKYHPELKFQILDAMFNAGHSNVWNKSPNYQKALKEYEDAEGWNDPNYDLTKIFKHADWNINDKKWLGVRARMRRNPQDINPEDYTLIYNNDYRDSLYRNYSKKYEDLFK